MDVAAEQIYQFETFQPTYEAPPPLVIVVPEMAEDVFTRHQAARFIGQIALEQTAAVTPDSSIGSLHEALPLAANGSETARQLITMNARTDVVERTIKAGHVMEVELAVDAQGKVWQHGQMMDAIQANTLTYAADHPVMRERSETELRNSLRIEYLHRQGQLEDYAFVVFSRAPDNMSRADMADAGFFIDTMSCAVQVTTASKDSLVTESAFVAGTIAPGAPRHDKAAVGGMIASLGVEMEERSATEMLDTPFLIHKSCLPNGASDLVKLYDDAAGGTFFGQAQPREDYVSFREKCREREAGFAPKVAAIVRQLVAEAPLITSPLEATARLHKISEKHMVEKAIEDTSINPLVFGAVAAPYIEQARYHQQQGQTQQAMVSIIRAQATAKSSSCPTAVKFSKELKKFTDLPGVDDFMETETEIDEGRDEDCAYISKECPVCHKKNVKTTSTKTKIEGDCGCVVKK